jgi:ubiquinol-cytochrome c reductase cytochrome b subunit
MSSQYYNYKTSKFKNIAENHLFSYPTPAGLYYIWGVGSLLGVLLILQVLTGILLAMHYIPSIQDAFSSVERITSEISGGWMLRYLHSNGSSFLFILLYIHIARGLFYSLYRKPRQ